MLPLQTNIAVHLNLIPKSFCSGMLPTPPEAYSWYGLLINLWAEGVERHAVLELYGIWQELHSSLIRVCEDAVSRQFSTQFGMQNL